MVVLMKNRDYWKERFLLLEKDSNKKGLEVKNKVEKIFTKAIVKLEREIKNWILRFATNNQISMAEARKWLNRKELEELNWSVEEYIKYGRENAINRQWKKQLENASARFHISRLEALKLHTQQVIENLYGDYFTEVDKMAKNIYIEDYYKTLYEFQKGLSLEFKVGKIDERKLKAVLNAPWGSDSMRFSERIWKNKEKMVNELQSELIQNIITGQPPQVAIDRIAKKMNTSKRNAGTLVMTEQAYYHAKAQKDVYEELGVEQVQIVATLDNKTSKICQEMDGKVIDRKDYLEGVTVPPFHPNCRSVTVPYFEDNHTPRWARYDERTTGIVEDMTYKEWREKYVDNGTWKEESKKGVIADTKMNRPRIEASEYRRRIDQLGETPEISRIIHKEMKEAVNHRSGTKYEDLIFIHSKTGETLRANEFEEIATAKPTKAMLKMLNRTKAGEIIAIHNHPNSSVPSLGDIMVAHQRGYKYGVIACHNGNIFKYSIIGEIDAGLANTELDYIHHILYNENIDRLKLNEKLKKLEKYGVKLEVL